VCSRKQSLNPPAERRIFLGKTRESRARPVDQQHPQVTVTRHCALKLTIPQEADAARRALPL
jgi:hypothetical protein